MSGASTSRFVARIGVNILLDGALAALAVFAAFWLTNPASPWPNPPALPVGGAIAIWLTGIPFGLSRQHWRFSAPRDLVLLGGAALVTALMLTLLMLGAGLALPSPSFPPILALTLIVTLIAPRLLYRLARQPAQPKESAGASTAMLAGTGESAEIFLAALARFPQAPYRITGLVALSPRHTGRRVLGLDFLGAVDEAESLFAKLETADKKPDLLIITAPELAGDALGTLLAAAEKFSIRVLRAPNLTALSPAQAGGQKIELQPIAIEDLLNRKQVPLDRDSMAALIADKRVLVTGAGGTIGAELARQVAGLNPSELLLLDNGEYALWQIDLELAETEPATKRRAVIADIRDRARMHAVCADFKPDLVFHAAALKHVPIVEANPLEGLQTNVLGTVATANAAAASGASLMVLISTDKAVNPVSVMGASKRLAEMYCQGLDMLARHGNSQTLRCVTVRFGNVLGSTGSVVPLFRRQLMHGGPLTVTHPDMRRYFMTVREAVGLVLQASAAGSGTLAMPDGGIFVLDMGAPVKIVDLARQMIRLAGLRPDIDIGITYTGLRPGEKLYEELFHGGEAPVPSGFAGLLMANPRVEDGERVAAAIDEIAAAAAAGDAPAALSALGRIVPEFAQSGC
jgi:O-antigen biosynthesis protein WbqV